WLWDPLRRRMLAREACGVVERRLGAAAPFVRASLRPAILGRDRYATSESSTSGEHRVCRRARRELVCARCERSPWPASPGWSSGWQRLARVRRELLQPTLFVVESNQHRQCWQLEGGMHFPNRHGQRSAASLIPRELAHRDQWDVVPD